MDIVLGVEKKTKNNPQLSPGGVSRGFWKVKGEAGTVPLVTYPINEPSLSVGRVEDFFRFKHLQLCTIMYNSIKYGLPIKNSLVLLHLVTQA